MDLTELPNNIDEKIELIKSTLLKFSNIENTQYISEKNISDDDIIKLCNTNNFLYIINSPVYRFNGYITHVKTIHRNDIDDFINYNNSLFKEGKIFIIYSIKYVFNTFDSKTYLWARGDIFPIFGNYIILNRESKIDLILN